MIFPGWQEFFEKPKGVGGTGAASVTVSMEEIYQHFKARLLDELSDGVYESGHDSLSRALSMELDRMRERGLQG